MLLRFLALIFSLASIGLIVGLGVIAAVLWVYGQDLPPHEELAEYQPDTVSRVYSQDGELIAEYVRERRTFAPIDEIPDLVKQAFISAEDKNFYDHSGVDYVQTAKAMVRNIERYRNGQRILGGSGITQQVVKNMVLTNERSVDRKIKEALLALRLEQTLSKDEILELYLNVNFLGSNSYGVIEAARNYFGKALEDLTAEEAAYLAALPKEPSNLHPVRHREKAVNRRNYVLREMMENGYLSQSAADAARAAPLATVMDGSVEPVLQSVARRDYFTQEIRRQMVDRFGAAEVDAGGLSIRATLDKDLQAAAAEALRARLVSWDQERGGWNGPLAQLDPALLGDEAGWRKALKGAKAPRDIDGWFPAVVLKVGNSSVRVGIESVEEDEDGHYVFIDDMKWARAKRDNGRLGPAPQQPADVLAVGDVVLVTGLTDDEGAFDRWALRQVPEIQGAFMAMDPVTGRVLAMQGGFSYEASVFNRATQAKRQPGSAFKPFVYASALDNGYTPASIILDAPVVIDQGNDEGLWRPQNASKRFYGPSPMRLGVEQSRNVMTVRLAQDVGMATVADYAQRFGVYDNMPEHLSYALGAGETTLYQMVAAYAMFANGGDYVEPTLVDRVQDRRGETLFRHDPRVCEECGDAYAPGATEPWVRTDAVRIMDGITAYQLVSMMQGVATRGTARDLRELGFPVAGKTGTTNDAKDAWFIGFTPNLVAGCYIGYDTPTPMGDGASGGKLCAPVFKAFMAKAMADRPKTRFRAPRNAVLIKVNRHDGVRMPDDASGDQVVLEAFRPEDVPDVYAHTGGVILDDGSFGFGEGGGDLPMTNEELNGGEAPSEEAATSDPGRPAPPKPGGGFGSDGLY